MRRPALGGCSRRRSPESYLNNMLSMEVPHLIALAGPGDVDEPLQRQGQHTVDTAGQGDAGQGEEGGQDQGEHPLLVHQGEGWQGERQ